MGAMVGAMYASGKMEECKEWLFSWDKRKMWELADLTLSRDGLVKGDRFIKELKQIIPDMNIEDLPVPYVAMATDIVRDQEVRFDRGSLHEAIRASISIPMLFRPLRKDGMVLIDGGILNPLPLSHVQRTEGDILIAVDVNAPIDTGKKKKHGAGRGLTIAALLGGTVLLVVLVVVLGRAAGLFGTGSSKSNKAEQKQKAHQTAWQQFRIL